MLFNSYEFIFAFLPVALMSFFASGVVNMRAATLWLTLASFGFCSWWSIHSPLILLASVAFNLLTGYAIAAARSQKIAKRLLHLGMAAEAADGAAGVPGDPHGKCEVHHAGGSLWPAWLSGKARTSACFGHVVAEVMAVSPILRIDAG